MHDVSDWQLLLIIFGYIIGVFLMIMFPMWLHDKGIWFECGTGCDICEG